MTNTDVNEHDGPTRDGYIKRHGKDGFEGMRKAGKLAAEVLDMLVEHVDVGVTTQQLDDLARNFILERGSVPATLFYRGYTKSLCTSINHVVCHGIPNDKPLKDGDILNIDVTVIVDGWHGDNSRMYAAGKLKRKSELLIDVTYDAMMKGIEMVQPGNTFGDIGAAIQEYAEGHRYSVVRDFCGHGLGQLFHDAPNVLHYGEYGEGEVMEPGMFFTIEPMLNAGKPSVKILNDGWTAVTRDKSLSAQFEHSVAVTEDGFEIFTLSPQGWHRPTAL